MRKESIVELESIGELHEFVQAPRPRHPLVSVIDHRDFYARVPKGEGMKFRVGFYTISCKKFDGLMYYGKGHYDFKDGSLVFTAPGQIVGAGPNIHVEDGWGLFVHPDLLYGTALGKKMHEYNFFHYEVNEALHISEEENALIRDCLSKIEREYAGSIDKHTQGLIVSNIELLLNYCDRFYDRQFYTRARVNADVVQRFESLLKEYFGQASLIESGLPPVTYFSSRLNLSPSYLSDLLQRTTGKSTLEHIHLELVDRAKSLLWGTESSISEIAYELGFEHPSHFTKIFKAKTGKSPSEFRNVN
jgi:AraC-like DNA-binding protein